MNRGRVRNLARTLVVTASVAALALGTTVVASAAKPTDKPATTLKLSAILADGSATLIYQVNVPASAIAAQDCVIRFPNGLVGNLFCDTTPDSGSGKKLTKLSISQSTPQVGDYSVEIAIDLVDGRHLFASTAFTVIGPAVRFEVTGLVEQEAICYAGIDCVGFPGPDYPRQVAMITALDAAGHVATGYNGTVSFENPVSHATPAGLSNVTLTSGVAHVAVAVPNLTLGYFSEPFDTHCPSNPATGNGVVLTATDTVDPTIFGCQNIRGGSLGIVFPTGFLEAISSGCPSGCFAEPTNSIVLNTNLYIPTPITPVITPNEPLEILAVTTTGYYATIPLDLGTTYIEGASIPVGAIDVCSNCTVEMNYLVPSTLGTVDAGLQVSSTTITIPTELTVVGLNDFWVIVGGSPDPVPVTAVVTGGSTPTCYTDGQLVEIVILTECGEDPFGP